MKKGLHGLLLLAVVLAIMAVPYRAFIGPIPFARLFGGNVDAVSSASVILDAPSGNYVVLLNAARHEKWRTAADWAAFFQGESLVIMDDVDCLVADSDAGGIQMAESYRSRLPENQMKLRREDGTLMLSRAEVGGFDAIVMSAEFAEAFKAETVYGQPGVEVLEIGGAAQ